ncbi:hypothetical protein [Sphingobacterium deserti]|uniref:Uncharacterized protein n=1 Tax=Sphingobacterium deserti TaxID=1229276 RepID=A0A0B8T4T2_9SPHI|nr:hypothetical protein [Sphingobacterium deserti]KGE15223.1 hypothetical protein DI53_0904 [Sphingobacterium deserti]
MDKLLITYGTRPFAQRLGKILSSKFACHYASCEQIPTILLKGDYRQIPTGLNPTFAHELLKLCLDEGFTRVLPLGKGELQPINETRVLFEEYGITILLPLHLEEHYILENPASSLPVHIVEQGRNILTAEELLDVTFSGVFVLADDGEEPALCLV